MRTAALTSAGKWRGVNEDTFTLLDLATGGWVLGVYDGTGECAPGQSAGHVAARVVAERLSMVPAGATGEELSRRLLEALQAAHQEIFAINQTSRRGVGTTATVAAISSGEVSIAHVGDSRGYLFTGGDLRQVTQDDTLVRELLAAGKLKPEEVETFLHKNVITRVLGLTEEVDVPVTLLALQAGDVLLLCTDGVWGMVDDPAIAAILGAHRDPAAACRALIEAADEAGGHDNETAVVGLSNPDNPAAIVSGRRTGSRCGARVPRSRPGPPADRAGDRGRAGALPSASPRPDPRTTGRRRARSWAAGWSGVIPGRVFTSRMTSLPRSLTTRSTRVAPSQPSASCASVASRSTER